MVSTMSVHKHRQAAESEAKATHYFEMAQKATAKVEMKSKAAEYYKNQLKLYGSGIHSHHHTYS